MNKARVLITDFSMGMVKRHIVPEQEFQLHTRAAELIENAYISPDGGVQRRPATGMMHSRFIEGENPPWTKTAKGRPALPTYDVIDDVTGFDEVPKIISSSLAGDNVHIFPLDEDAAYQIMGASASIVNRDQFFEQFRSGSWQTVDWPFDAPDPRIVQQSFTATAENSGMEIIFYCTTEALVKFEAFSMQGKQGIVNFRESRYKEKSSVVGGMTYRTLTQGNHVTKPGRTYYLYIDGEPNYSATFTLTLLSQDGEPTTPRFTPVRKTRTELYAFADNDKCWFFDTNDTSHNKWKMAYPRNVKYAVDIRGRVFGYNGSHIYAGFPNEFGSIPDANQHDMDIDVGQNIAWMLGTEVVYFGTGAREHYMQPSSSLGFTNEEPPMIALLTETGARVAKQNQQGMLYILQDGTVAIASDRQALKIDSLIDAGKAIEVMITNHAGGMAIFMLDSDRRLWMASYGQQGFAWAVLDTDILWFTIYGNELTVAKSRPGAVTIEVIPVLRGKYFDANRRASKSVMTDAVYYLRIGKDGGELFKDGYKAVKPIGSTAGHFTAKKIVGDSLEDFGTGNFSGASPAARVFTWNDGSGKTEENIIGNGEAIELLFTHNVEGWDRPVMRIKTLPINIPSMHGSSLGIIKRISSVVVRVKDTMGIRVKCNDSQWEEKVYDTAYSGNIEFAINSGYEDDVTVEIESVGNLPLQVYKIQADVVIGDT